jgi:amidase
LADNREIDVFDDPLGAFCRDNHVSLMHSARGVLSGLRFAVKDAFHIAGSRTGFGNPDWIRTHEPATETAVAVESLLAAGADLIGKTHTDELTYSLSGENTHYGTPVNPAAPERIPGGSSSGSASAVAAGVVDFALGTDCGGSVRLPAGYCGILGMRPTHGRVSVAGVIPLAPTFDVVGWFARDAGIFERVGQVLLNDHTLPVTARRLLIAQDAFDLLSPEVDKPLRKAVAAISDTIGASKEVNLSDEGLAAWFEIFRVIQASEIWAGHGAWIRQVKPQIGRGIAERLEWASRLSAEDTAAARKAHDKITARLGDLFAPGDILCLPTSPRAAPLKNEATDKIEVEFRHQAMCLLCIAGLGGLPQVSLPLATVNGLPLGLSLLGPRGSDTQLLALAKQLLLKAPGIA